MKKKISVSTTLIAPIVTFAQEKGLDQKIDEAFQPVSDFFNDVIFFEVLETPFVLVLLVLSAAFLPSILDFQTFDILELLSMWSEGNMMT